MSCIPSAIVSDDLNLWFHDHTASQLVTIMIACIAVVIASQLITTALIKTNKNIETSENSIQKFLKTTTGKII